MDVVFFFLDPWCCPKRKRHIVGTHLLKPIKAPTARRPLCLANLRENHCEQDEGLALVRVPASSYSSTLVSLHV